MSKTMVCIGANLPHGQTFVLPGGKRVSLNGNAEDLRGLERGILREGVYGLTTVDADDWEEVKKLFGSMVMFRSGLILETDSKADTEKEASKNTKTRHGLEAVDPEKTGTKPGKGRE